MNFRSTVNKTPPRKVRKGGQKRTKLAESAQVTPGYSRLLQATLGYPGLLNAILAYSGAVTSDHGR